MSMCATSAALQNYVFTGKGLGTTVFMSSDSLFEANGGFCKDEKIVIGVHISAIEMVSASGSLLK